ncbi:hypothetical protein QE152_g19146 [Popillia japonica]|uniref:Transposable element P transposase-like GTP-binding insertion domain-containing protein n=1 Tax=Popillia japonica TaxID=7064 RepID=A0AAW1L326_POPJA
MGCSLAIDNKLTPNFSHPCSPNKMHCLLDNCHMMKLARNRFAERNLVSEKGPIRRIFVAKLNDLQEKDEMKFGNNLSSRHILYKNKIMKVRLAVQALSSSMADAIEYLRQTGHADFQNSESTVEFIRNIDRMFDMLNP